MTRRLVSQSLFQHDVNNLLSDRHKNQLAKLQDSLKLASHAFKGHYLALQMGGCLQLKFWQNTTLPTLVRQKVSFSEINTNVMFSKQVIINLERWHLNMKMNRSEELLKTGTQHIKFLRSLKSLLLTFLAKQDLTAVSNILPVHLWMGKLTSICHLRALITILSGRVSVFWWWLC